MTSRLSSYLFPTPTPKAKTKRPQSGRSIVKKTGSSKWRAPYPKSKLMEANPMSKVYMLVKEDGMPMVWRLQGVKPSVRIYEDGNVANKSRALANDLGYGPDVILIKLNSVVEAHNYVTSLLREEIWFHHFPLCNGYSDEYTPQCYDCASAIEECLCEVDGYEWAV